MSDCSHKTTRHKSLFTFFTKSNHSAHALHVTLCLEQEANCDINAAGTCDVSICAFGDNTLTVSVSYDDGANWAEVASTPNYYTLAEHTIPSITEPARLQFLVDDHDHTGGFAATVQLDCDGFSRTFYTDDGTTMFDVVYSENGDTVMDTIYAFGGDEAPGAWPKDVDCMNSDAFWVWNGVNSDNVIFEVDLFGNGPFHTPGTVRFTF